MGFHENRKEAPQDTLPCILRARGPVSHKRFESFLQLLYDLNLFNPQGGQIRHSFKKGNRHGKIFNYRD